MAQSKSQTAEIDVEIPIVKKLQGLYAITPDECDNDTLLLQRTAAVLSGGAALLQYRNKNATADKRRLQALQLAELCGQYEVPLIINDHVDLVITSGAAGVHLGQHDLPVSAARNALGPAKLIGVSCYDSLELALLAQRDGADYVAFGAVFPTALKPDAPLASLQLLAKAKRSLHIPVVAIGGINTDNASAVVGTGVDAIAVISALYNARSPQRAAATLAALF